MSVLFTLETPLVNPWPRSIFLHWLQPLFITFYNHHSSNPLSYFHLFHYTINRFVFYETGKIDNLSAVGGKVIGWVCAVPCLLKIKRQRSSTFTLLLMSMSYWYDKPRFVYEGKLLLTTSTPSLGAQPNAINYDIKQFSGAIAGDFGPIARGVSYSQSIYFVFVLLALFLV